MAKRPDTGKLRDQAAAYSAKGKHRKALEIYLELERLEPKDGSWSRRSGEMYRHLGEDHQAIVSWNRACDRYAAAGFLVKAVAVCKMILRVDPQQREAQQRLASLNCERGFLPAASEPAAHVDRDAAIIDMPLSQMVAGSSEREVASGPSGVIEIPIDIELDGDDLELVVEQADDSVRSALVGTPLLSALSAESLESLIEKVRLVEIPAGMPLFHQGDRGTTLFVVAEGQVRVVAEDSPRRPLGVLGEGAFFGEISLVTDQGRTATVEAVVDTELLAIDRHVIGELIAREPGVLTVMLRFLRDRMVENLIASSPLFAPFLGPERQALAARFRFLEVEAGAAIIRENEVSPGLFVIMAGALEVRRGAEDPKLLASLGAGDICGEMSLLAQVGAVASVVATRKSLLLELPAAAFREVIMTHPQVLAFVGDLASDRERQLAAVAEGGQQYEELHLDFL